MAKSARSSRTKRNNSNLRKKVFGPVYDARTERLSAKLMELANTPKPDEEKKMDVEEDKGEGETGTAAEDPMEDEDMQWTGIEQRKSRSKAASRAGRVAKRKPRNQVVFPSEIARKKRQMKSKKT